MGNYSETTGKISFDFTDDMEKINKIKAFLYEGGLTDVLNKERKNHWGNVLPLHSTLFEDYATVNFDSIDIEFNAVKAYDLPHEIMATVKFLTNIGMSNIEVDIVRYGEVSSEDIEHYKLVDNKLVTAQAEIKYAFRNYSPFA